jgi:hypothetical protein
MDSITSLWLQSGVAVAAELMLDQVVAVVEYKFIQIFHSTLGLLSTLT